MERVKELEQAQAQELERVKELERARAQVQVLERVK
jgi:hypothetical protein